VELFEELTDGVVTLRPWTMDDLPALVEACNDETLHYWLPMIPFPYTTARYSHAVPRPESRLQWTNSAESERLG